ncbi:O-antigen ligase family protein [Candidatus Roizmanbacteria bacterium]|nr:O-antigen ligase family protein [Candidatus Roizmanbacteria bacterium]
MGKLLNWFRWLDTNLIKLLLILFIFLIPLWPKLPLFDLEYTYVSIRFEDLFIAFFVLIFFIQLIRNKITLPIKFIPFFFLFWTGVFASYLFGHYVLNTVPVKNIGFLHAFRRVEYMIFFFIAASAVKSRRDFSLLMNSIFLVLLIVSLYGIGQKFFGFPAVQTMNPEFALGHILYLTPEARVSSTFAGHYDLAAYLVFLIPIVLGFYLSRRALIYFALFIVTLFTLVLTASRISFISYSLSVAAFMLYLRKPKLLMVIVILTIGFSLLSKNLTSRFFQTFQVRRIFVNEKTGQVVIPQKITVKELPAGTFYLQIKKDQPVKVDSDLQKKLEEKLLADIREEASKSGKTLTSTEEAQLLATMSAGLKPLNTVVSDISFATRLQVEWPRAIQAFLKNPILGAGASSITEATDNDYLRLLGEFGLLGTVLFVLILSSITFYLIKHIDNNLQTRNFLVYGYLFGFFGLMLNATYIDVFEASKVAYTFWTIAGLYIGFFKTNYE